MAKVTIIKMDGELKKYFHLIVGIGLVVLGAIIVYDYIIAFFRIVLGLILIGFGIYYMTDDSHRFGKRFFRF